jgi:hypothetical protein
MIAMLADFTSMHPIFVCDAEFRLKLLEGIVSNPFATIRKSAQKEIDANYKTRLAETHEHSYDLPLPDPGQLNAHGTREQVEVKNDKARSRLRKILAQEKIVVREWEIFLRSIIWFVNGSRYIQYGYGLFKFIMAVLLIYCDEKWNQTLTTVLLVGIWPLVITSCFQNIVQLGTSDLYCITDEELCRELSWLVCIFRSCCCSCSFYGQQRSPPANDNGNGSSDNSGKSACAPPSLEMQTMAGGAVLNPIVHTVDTIPAVKSSEAAADEWAPEPIASRLPANVDVDADCKRTRGGEAEQSISASLIMHTGVLAPTTEIEMNSINAITAGNAGNAGNAQAAVVRDGRIKAMAHTFEELAAIAAGDMPRAPPLPPPPPLPALPPPADEEEEEEERKESTTGKL